MQTQGMRWLGSNRIASTAIGVGLLAAALVMPAAASAQTGESSPFISRDACLFLEENIEYYDCNVSIAQWAGGAELVELLAAPDGVDHLFWEQNVLNFADLSAAFAGNADPQPVFPGPDDVEQQSSGVANY